MESTASEAATISIKVGTSVIPAASAKRRVRSLLPERQVITSSPCSLSRRPTAWPMSPGLRIATLLKFTERAS